MVTKVTSSNFSSSVNNIITAAASIPTISNVQPTDSSYTVSGLTVLDPSATAYVKITGTNFSASSQVFIESTLATTVTYISSTQLNVVLPSKSTGSYVLYVVNSDGSVAIRINAVTYSTSPVWSTSSSLPGNNMGNPISIQLAASSDSNVVYTVSSGSLPPGLSLSSGGLLSGTVSGLSASTTYNFTVTATDIENQANNRAFSITITVSDPFWSYTTLMVNSETASTPFISDASTNNLGLVVNGDTKATTYTPYRSDGYYSAYFNGTSAYLSAPTNAAYQFGSGDFTVEFWAYPTSMAGYAVFGGVWTGTNSTSSWLVSVGATDTTALRFGYSDGSAATFVESTTGAVKLNTWTHLAVVRTSGVLKMFSNGAQVYSSAVATTFASPASALVLGAAGAANYGQFYASNLRVVKGTAVYTSAFTPPTAPLTAISGTSALICQSNRFIDTSSVNATLTLTGGPAISPSIPFVANSSYATYGSAYFDGTGDYLTTAYTPNLTGDFTIEFWTNASSWPSSPGRQLITDNVATYALYDGTTLTFNAQGGSNFTSTFSVPTNSWVHWAVSRQSGTIRFFINGVSKTVTPFSAIGTATFFASPLIIGGTPSYQLTGYMADLRIVSGTALYTTTFTPPTSLLTAVSGTSLLTLQYNGSVTNNEFLDQSSFNNLLTRAGNATQGTFSPYSQTGWSNYFDGTGDQLTTGTNLSLSGAPYTIEMWIYTSTTLNAQLRPYIISLGDNQYVAYDHTDNAGSKLRFNGGFGTITMTENQWHHIALVNNTTDNKVYIDGALDFTFSYMPVITNAAVTIGGWGANGSQFNYAGYISNLRVSTEVVYSSAFAPPTTPLIATANTVLLTCQSNRLVDNSSNNNIITKAGDVSVQAFSPFGSITIVPTTYSNYFDGTGDYLGFPSNTAIRLGTSDFTVEAWIKISGSTASRTICSNYLGGTDFIFGVWSGRLSWLVGGSITLSSDDTIVAGTWYHVAAVRSSGTLKLYVNGVETTTSLADSNNYAATGNIFIGYAARAPAVAIYAGYISNLRITKSAIYSASFTPSTVPLVALANTQLLTCQSTVMQDNSINSFALTAAGDVRPDKVNPFGTTTSSSRSYTPSLHGGSVYYDGAGDYLTLPSSSTNYNLLGDFTIEGWVYPTTLLANSWGFIDARVSGGTAAAWAVGLDNVSSQYKLNFFTGTSCQGTINIPLNTWTHIALTRTGSALASFVNGVRDYYNATYGTGAISPGTTAPRIGTKDNGIGGYETPGYISDIRFINGTSMYSAAFIPPTAPLTSPMSTPANLLLNFTNGGVIDQHSSSVLETVGNAQLSTTVKKFGNASIYFDGSGDRLVTSPGPLNSLGSGDFTIESWVYSVTLPANARLLSQGSSTTGEHLFIVYSSGAADFCEATTARLSFPAGSFVTATWQHIAIVRSGTALKGYVNGSSVVSTTSTYNYSAVTNTYIGSNPNTGSQDFNGYIDDFRITKGYARYSSNFAVPTSSFLTK